MTAVITVPASLDEQSFEQVLEQVVPLAPDVKILVDARHTRFATQPEALGIVRQAQSNSVSISDGVRAAVERINRDSDTLELTVVSDENWKVERQKP